jgi:hypothetical protein
MTRLIVRPAAEADTLAAVTLYSKRDRPLGVRFVDDGLATVEEL